jgi:DnaJ-domain-containing protein 1
MDLMDRLKRAAGNIPWSTVASVMAQNMAAGPHAEAAYSIMEQLHQWGSRLTDSALRKWPAAILAPTMCDSPDVSTGRPKPCKSHATVRCDVCGRPCCLAHARVDYMADAICEVCIGEAKARARSATGGYKRPAYDQGAPASPSGMSAAEALKALKLSQGATWQQIKAQYRKLAVKHNVDRPQSEKQRAMNVERLKKINAAYAVLREMHERKEAA